MSPRRTRQDWKRPRKVNIFPIFEKRIYIFCEGIKTEPNYFEGLKRSIESNAIYKNKILIQVEGVGADTLGVLNYAIDYIATNNIENSEIWLVYDKDSFSDRRFNEVVTRVETLNKSQDKVKYFTAWSNQCIEYWFILHFDYYDSDNDRTCYRKYLNQKFKEIGYSKYTKNNPHIYNILANKGSPDLAIRHAQRRIDELSGLTPSKMAPSTMVHKLYKKLNIYLPQD